MTYFYAERLFDGECWQASHYFQVDTDGFFRNLSSSQLNSQIKEEATSLGTVIPGFINCHSHSFQRAMAGLGERISCSNRDDSFWTWREQMYRLAHKLTPQTFRVIANWLYVEMLESGYTSVGEFHYLHKLPSGQNYESSIEMAQQLIQSAEAVQMRLCLLPVLYQLAGIEKPLSAQQAPFGMSTLEEYETYHQALAQHIPAGFNLGVAVHSIRAVSREQLRAFAQNYNPRNIPIHIHIAEQPAEVEESLAHYQKRPVEFLLETVPVNANWTLVHATHITAEERQQMTRCGVTAGLCPITEANLGDGIFPMKAWFLEGGHTAIGSDSHIRIDPFEELRWIEYSQRYQLGARACVTTNEKPSPGFNLATACYQGGQISLKLPVGCLKDGFYADFLELRSDHPATLRLDPDTLWDELIFAGSRELIQSVYVGGNHVLSQGRHHQHCEALEAFRELLIALASSYTLDV